MNLQREKLVVAGLALVVGLIFAAPAPAQELGKAAASLELVPADAATYTVMLRNREQIEAIAKSKAWARFTSLGFVKMLQQKFDDEWSREGGQLAPVREWYEKGDGKQLLSLLGDLVADEVFFYGGKDSVEFLVLLQELNSANQFAPIFEALQGRPGRPEDRLRFLLHALSDNADRIKVPDGVIGFRLKDTKAAKAQLERLEKLTGALAAFAPDFKDRVKKVKIGGGEFQSLQLDGSLVPWDAIPWQMIEDNAGEFEPLVKKLKQLKFTLSIGLRDNFLLIGYGEGTASLEALGGKTRLADRAELKPLAKFSDRRLTSIAYVSKEAQARLTPGMKDVEDSSKWLVEQLKAVGLPEEKIDKVKKDLKDFAKDMKRFEPEPGALLAFSFLTDKGYEGYAYDWSKNHGLVGTKPLTLLNHVGGSPLFYHVSRSNVDPKDYEIMVKWLKVGYKYFDEWALPMLPQEFQQIYQQFFQQVEPLLGRLDKTTGKMLLPALADGQGAIVIDAKLKSKQWFQFMPPTQNPLPMIEPAVVLGVSDADLLKKAFKEYRAIANDFIGIIAQLAPELGEFKIPEPKTKDVKGGTIYSFPLPQDIADPQINPSAAISKDVVAFAISQEHAERLLTKTAPKAPGLAKADQKLASAFYLDFAGLIDALAPWIDMGMQAGGADNDVVEQVQVVMQILKVFRGASGVTYLDGDAVVSRSEIVIRDLEK